MGFTPQPTFEITTMESLINMVGAGMGITLLPRPYLESLENDQLKIIPIADSILTRDLGIIYRKDKYMGAATKAFIEQLHLTIHQLKESSATK